MQIYINGILQRTEILPSNTPTLDETLETFSFALISNDNPLPLAPMQLVKVDFLDDNSDVAYFYIVSDSVETFSLKPLKYKHNISCIQNTRKLSKHLVRNSVFSQPPYLNKKAFNAESAYTGSYYSGQAITFGNPDIPSLNWASEKLSLDFASDNIREKIKSAKLKISFQFVFDYFDADATRHYTTNSTCHNTSEVLAAIDDAQEGTPINCIDTLTAAASLTLQYDDANGVAQTPETITPSTFGVADFDLNTEYDFPRIKELANQGYNNFEIHFGSLDFLTGTYKTGISPSPLPPQLRFYMVQVQIVAETYYYNCYELLTLIAKRQMKQTSIDGYINRLFWLPTQAQDPSLYNLLTATIAPNFTFTQLTMYECVAEVFRLFDAIFTMNYQDVLGIEYFNDLDSDVITPKLTGRTLALGEDKYTNGLVVHYQDARIVENFPKQEGKFAPLRSAEFGVPEAQDHVFLTPHSIDSIVKCEILTGITLPQASIPNCGELAVDISNYVFEESVYSLLEKGTIDPDDKTAKQCNSVFFQRGDNKIKVAYSFKDSWQLTNIFPLYQATNTALMRMAGTDLNTNYKPSDDLKTKWYNVKMRAAYMASIDGKTQIHSITNKYEGETLIDQANGAVDLNKMGLNMLGLSLKLGNPTLNATHRISTWANRIKVGQLYFYQGKNWVANVVNYTFFNGAIQGKISFVQNFNQLALRTQLLREKRMTNISKELTQKSEEIITDFVYFTTAYPTGEQGETIHFNDIVLRNAILLLNPTLKFGDVVAYNTGSNLTKAIYVPTIAYGAGNTLNFEMSFDHPMSAGNQTKYDAPSTWYGSSKYYTNYVAYTNDYGFKDSINVRAPVDDITFNEEFPIVQVNAYNSPSSASYFDIRNFMVYKQPNEIFALNYQLAFLPYPGRENIDFIMPEFCNNHPFIKNITDSGSLKRYICFFSKQTSNLDLKASDYLLKEEVTATTSVDGNNVITMAFNFSYISSSVLNNTKSWAIVDNDDNILLASNSHLFWDDHVIVYVFTKLKRLN